MGEQEQQPEKSAPVEAVSPPDASKEADGAQNTVDAAAPDSAAPASAAPAPEAPTAPEAPANPTAATATETVETPVATETKPPAEPATESKPPVEPATETKTPAEPTTETKTPAAEPTTTPIAQLWSLAQATGHPEIWGVALADPESHVPTQIILQKYLNANDGDLPKAKDQLTKTLEWRAKTKPLELVKKAFSKAKFDGLGYVTTYAQEGSTEPESREIFTWNIYGGVKSIDETFGKLEEFLEWRVALMELALQALDLSSATKPITAEYDPYKIFQVHDYKSISFLRQSPHVKSASAETIKVFAQNYPELLKEKFFVNVPAIMGFVYAFMKLFVAAKTIKKFHPMSNGDKLALEFGEGKVAGLGEKLPANYGGKGAELGEQGKGPLLE